MSGRLVGRLAQHVVHDAGTLTHWQHAWDRPWGQPLLGGQLSHPTQPYQPGSLGFPLLFTVLLHEGALLGNDMHVGMGILGVHGLVTEGETAWNTGHWWCCRHP